MTTRSERLLAVLQILQRHRRPVAARALADETGTSLRTVYRDIEALRAQGAVIEGEAGIGYLLTPGYLLPPLMFTRDELEALVLGARLVAARADPGLAEAAGNAIGRIGAVLPEELRLFVDTSPLLVPGRLPGAATPVMAELREAMRTEHRAEIAYRALDGHESRRVIWPLAMGFFESVQTLVAWCELRGGYRHFREDRIAECRILAERYPRRRSALMREWTETERDRRSTERDAADRS